MALGLLALPDPAFAQQDKSLSLELRYRSKPASPDAIDETILYRAPFLGLSSEVGVRASVSALALESVQYKGEWGTDLLGYFGVWFRFSHSSQLPGETGTSTLLGYVTLEVPFGSLLTFSSAFGYFARLTQLDAEPLIPAFGPSFTKQDFAARIGLRFLPENEWSAALGIATFEALDTFNLQNPFIEAAIRYQPSDNTWSASLTGRYRVLLGFGRLSEFLLGANLTMPLSLESK